MSGTEQNVGLPVNIPWTLIETSREMMDRMPAKEGGKNIAPPLWRSSIAVYAYEPKEGELDHIRCGDRITFIKVSCSITGYQLSKEDAGAIIDLTDRWDLEIGRNIQHYFACHGVLVNISVFPHPLWDNVFDQPSWSDFPHIIDFEPKKRDLYEAVTEKGEVLTASKSTIKTDKSLSTTEDSQTGVDVGAEIPLEYVKGKIGLSQKWGMKATDSINIISDSSSERKETQGTSTNLSQMYNLLTGYHVGTNRATFLMLPRPHTVQPTLRRTFVQGFREIEGIQDFFLIVSRPKDADAFCVQVSVETGHIVNTPIIAAGSGNPGWEYKSIVLEYKAKHNGLWPYSSVDFLEHFQPFLPGDNWEFDPDKGDPGHVAVSAEVEDHILLDLTEHNYQVEDPNRLIVSGSVYRGPISPTNVSMLNIDTLNIKYTVYLRRIKNADYSHNVDSERLVITHRDLTACVKFEDGCPKQINPNQSEVDKPDLNINPDVLIVDDVPLRTRFSAGSGMSVLREAMTAGESSPSRSEKGVTSFLDTDAFREVIRNRIPKDILNQPLDKIDGIPEAVRKRIVGLKTKDIMEKDLTLLARRMNIDPETVREIRRRALGFSPRKNPENKKQAPKNPTGRN